MKNNTITTIIPFYNGENTLNRIIDSVLNQTYKPTEILLIDDGSTDGSKDICAEYAQQYDIIKYHYLEHNGVSAARNYGIEHASCTWISFLDADDYIEPDMYNCIISTIFSQDTNGSICGFFTENNNVSTEKIPFLAEDKINSHGIIMDILFSEDAGGVIWNRLFKKEMLSSVRFQEDISICEDLLFQVSLFTQVNANYSLIKQPFYHYVYTTGSATTSLNYFADGVFKYQKAFKRIFDIFTSNDQWDYLHLAKSKYQSILDYSMYCLLKEYKSTRSKDLLKQIRSLQCEMKMSDCVNKSLHYTLMKYFPIIYMNTKI